LFREQYKGKDKNFMTVNADNGINIDFEPYKQYMWYVFFIPIDGSNLMTREAAEIAFDKVYKKPIYSKR